MNVRVSVRYWPPLVATVADPNARPINFSAWIGLVPKQHSSGGKDRLGSISKQSDRYLRSLFMAGALAVCPWRWRKLFVGATQTIRSR